MTEGKNIDRETAARVLPVLNKTVDVLFAKAPVMMHSLGSDGSLNRVNDRRSQVLGYEPKEVLGKEGRRISDRRIAAQGYKRNAASVLAGRQRPQRRVSACEKGWTYS